MGVDEAGCDQATLGIDDVMGAPPPRRVDVWARTNPLDGVIDDINGPIGYFLAEAGVAVVAGYHAHGVMNQGIGHRLLPKRLVWR